MDEKTFDELLMRAFEATPQEIQDFISEGELQEFVLSLRAHLNLPENIADQVSDQITLVLLGISEIGEFGKALKQDVGLSPELSGKIVTQTEQRVFRPLAGAIINEKDIPAGALPPGSKEQGTASKPLPGVQNNVPPKPATPVMPPPAQRPPISSPPPRRPAPVPPKPIPPPPSARLVPPIAPPHARTMASDVQMIHPDKNNAPKPPPPPPVPPPPKPQPPQNVHEDLKQYGVDPYREPIQ